jgi:hypothetical protein
VAHDVFISYSNQDKSVADAVCATLESKKIRCWIAPRDVLPGISYAEALIDGLNQSHIMVLVFSANSNKSPQVIREVERAVNKGITIIPLRIEDVIPSKAMEYFVSSSHWLDALTPPLEKHLQKLADSVQKLLASQAQLLPDQEPVLPSPQPDSGLKRRSRVRPLHIVISSVVVVLIIAGAFYLTGGFAKRNQPPANVPPSNVVQTTPPLPPPAPKGLAFQDDFSSFNSGWPRFSDDTREVDYINGEYSILVKKPDFRVGYVNRNAGRLKDLVLEVDARLLSGLNKTLYGVSFRLLDSDNYYCFLLSGQGDYSIQKRVKGVTNVIQSKSAPAFIKSGNTVNNHLKVICKGSSIEVTCNGHQLANFTDTTFVEGSVGLLVHAYEPPACAHFDNFAASGGD